MAGSTANRNPRDLQARRYVFLFAALVLTFLILPFLREGSLGDLLLDVLLLAVLLSSLRAVWRDRRTVIAVALLGLGLFAAPGWRLIEPSKTTELVSLVALIGFLGTVTAALSLDVYRARSVTFGTILGACSVYLLIGVLWFGVFGLIEAAQPASFAFSDVHDTDLQRAVTGHADAGTGMQMIKRGQLFYYTFVTLSTLGYGDIRPVSEVARVYATLAALTGQLFLAILVARLVAIHTAQRGSRPGE